jgi:CRP-like cAMP-binding protein
MSPQSTVQLLMRVPLLAGITEGEAYSLFEASQKLQFKKNDILVEMGQTAQSFYLILSGRVKVVLTGGKDKSVTLALLGAGECLGEMGVLDHQPASATVVAMGTVDVLRLDQDAFRDVLHRNPHISATILKTLVQRVNLTLQQIILLSTSSVQARVGRSLMGMATPLLAGELQIKGKVRQSELADQIGASRLMVGKALKDLEAKGFIKKKSDGTLRIIDKRVRQRT